MCRTQTWASMPARTIFGRAARWKVSITEGTAQQLNAVLSGRLGSRLASSAHGGPEAAGILLGGGDGHVQQAGGVDQEGRVADHGRRGGHERHQLFLHVDDQQAGVAGRHLRGVRHDRTSAARGDPCSDAIAPGGESQRRELSHVVDHNCLCYCSKCLASEHGSGDNEGKDGGGRNVERGAHGLADLLLPRCSGGARGGVRPPAGPLAGPRLAAGRFQRGFRRLGEAGMRFTVSFDDGRQSVCQVAQRVLDSRGVKAMLYVVTDYVCRGLTYRDARPPPACTWPQLGGWLAAGHEIGSHTHTHAVLPAASPDWAQEELERSREILQRELGCRPTHFAYPYGDHDAGTYNKLKGLGDWASAATTDRGWNDSRGDPLLLRRDAVEPDWSAMHCGLRLAVGRRPALARAPPQSSPSFCRLVGEGASRAGPPNPRAITSW